MGEVPIHDLPLLFSACGGVPPGDAPCVVLRYFEPQFNIITMQLLEKTTDHWRGPQLIIAQLRTLQYAPDALIANFQYLALFQQPASLTYPFQKPSWVPG